MRTDNVFKWTIAYHIVLGLPNVRLQVGARFDEQPRNRKGREMKRTIIGCILCAPLCALLVGSCIYFFDGIWRLVLFLAGLVVSVLLFAIGMEYMNTTGKDEK